MRHADAGAVQVARRRTSLMAGYGPDAVADPDKQPVSLDVTFQRGFDHRNNIDDLR